MKSANKTKLEDNIKMRRLRMQLEDNIKLRSFWMQKERGDLEDWGQNVAQLLF